MAIVDQPPLPLEVSVVPNRDEVAVVAAGELDFASAGLVEQEILALREVGFSSIVIDLHQVAFLDSGGLHMLLRVRELAIRDGFSLSLTQPSAPVARVFAITGTQDRFVWQSHFRP